MRDSLLFQYLFWFYSHPALSVAVAFIIVGVAVVAIARASAVGFLPGRFSRFFFPPVS